MKIYIVTIINLNDNGYNPTNAIAYEKREDAVAKVKELFEERLKFEGISEEDAKGDYTIGGDMDCKAPFLPYAYCHDYYVDCYESDLN